MSSVEVMIYDLVAFLGIPTIDFTFLMNHSATY